MALGMLMAIGAVNGEDHPFGMPGADYQNGGQPYNDQYAEGQYGQSGYNFQYGSDSSSQVLESHDKHNHQNYNNYNNHHNYYYDWLSPGSLYWTYSYPVYYNYYYTPYPQYYYTAPVTHYYTWYPTVYNWDPWYATNVYGFGSTTYSYSSSWSYHSGGFFFDP